MLFCYKDSGRLLMGLRRYVDVHQSKVRRSRAAWRSRRQRTSFSGHAARHAFCQSDMLSTPCKLPRRDWGILPFARSRTSSHGRSESRSGDPRCDQPNDAPHPHPSPYCIRAYLERSCFCGIISLVGTILRTINYRKRHQSLGGH